MYMNIIGSVLHALKSILIKIIILKVLEGGVEVPFRPSRVILQVGRANLYMYAGVYIIQNTFFNNFCFFGLCFFRAKTLGNSVEKHEDFLI